MKRLWADDPVTYKGRFYSCEDASFAPKPVQRPPSADLGRRREPPRLPSRGPVRRGVPPGADVAGEGGRDAKASSKTQCEKLGRAPGSVRMCVKLPLVFQDGPGEFPTQGTPRQVVDGIRRYIDLGAEHFTLDFVPEKLDVALDVMERFAQEVRPKLD